LLVIDDGSTDESIGIIETVLKDCPFPSELIARGNRGLSATLNEGFAKTKGRYFAYLGSDDVWLREFLEARVKALSENPSAVLVYGHTYVIDEFNRVVECSMDWPGYGDSNTLEMLLRGSSPMSPTVVYRRDALQRKRWNEGARLEDYDLYLRLTREGQFAFDEKVLSAWRVHGKNTSRDRWMMTEEILLAQKGFLESIGWSPGRIASFQAGVKLDRAEEFLRIGDKASARKLFLQNLRGVFSSRRLFYVLARFILPYGLTRLHQGRISQSAFEKYGSIKI
jgi:glycosyltransferase involved in cell wall biosynthesis